MAILGLILSAPGKHIANFLESYIDIEGRENTGKLLTHFFEVGLSILSNEAWPSAWLNVNILSHRVLLKMFEPIAFILLRDFIPEEGHPGEQFDVNLWRGAFTMLLCLLSSDQLIIEEFSPQVCRRIFPVTPGADLRICRNVELSGDWRMMSVVRVLPLSFGCGKPLAIRRLFRRKLEP